MGCTSSTPNMVNSSATEKSIHFEEEISDNRLKNTEETLRDGNVTNESSGHPTLTEHNIHLVRIESTPEPGPDTEKDDKEDSQFRMISDKQTVSSDTMHEEEKVPKLEEVVEKVVELHTLENVDQVVELHTSENVDEMQPDLKIAQESQNSQESNDKYHIKEANDNEEPVIIEQDEQIECHPEEAVSPSQSESSRATRWEALADIAAELPPSLTVDPITGQIYAVSK